MLPTAVTLDPRTRWRTASIAVALAIVLHAPGLGILELRGEEATRIMPAIAMLDGGDWLRPTLNGLPYDNKPPLINWLIAASFAIQGRRDEAAARLVSAVCIAALALVIALGAGPWFDARARLCAALAMSFNAAMLEKGRLIEIEATYVAFTGMAIVLFVSGAARGCRGFALHLPAVIPLALALLTKGPAHLLAYGGAVIGVLAALGRSRELKHPALPLSIAASAVPFAVWALLARARGGPVGERWSDEIGSRLDAQGFDILRNLGESALGLALLLPAGIGLLWWWRRPCSTPSERGLRGLLLGTLLAYGLLSCLPGLRTRYLFICYPGFALAAGAALAAMPGSAAIDRWIRHLAATLTGFVAFALALAWCFASALGIPHTGWPCLARAGAVFAVAACAAAIAWRRLGADPLASGLRIALTAGALFLAAEAWSTPLSERVSHRRIEGQRIASHLPAGERLHLWRPGRMSLLFYLPHDALAVEDETRLADVRWLLLRASDQQELSLRHPRIAGAQVLHLVPPRTRGDFRLLRLSP